MLKCEVQLQPHSTNTKDNEYEKWVAIYLVRLVSDLSAHTSIIKVWNCQTFESLTSKHFTVFPLKVVELAIGAVLSAFVNFELCFAFNLPILAFAKTSQSSSKLILVPALFWSATMV